MNRTRLLAIPAAAVLAAGISIPVVLAATASHSVFIGNCQTEGEFVTCSVEGDIPHPSSITATVWSTGASAGQVQVDWFDSCEAGFNSGDRSGQYTVTASPSRKSVRKIPLAAGHSGTCTPDIDISPTGTGRVYLSLSGKN